MEAILKVVERLNRAWPAGDFDQLTEIFDPGAVLVSFAPGGERRVVGRDAVIQSYREFVGQSVLHRFEIGHPRVDAFSATAIASCPYSIDYEVGGRRWVGAGQDVLVLSEGSEGWRVVWRTLLPGEEHEVGLVDAEEG